MPTAIDCVTHLSLLDFQRQPWWCTIHIIALLIVALLPVEVENERNWGQQELGELIRLKEEVDCIIGEWLNE